MCMISNYEHLFIMLFMIVKKKNGDELLSGLYHDFCIINSHDHTNKLMYMHTNSNTGIYIYIHSIHTYIYTIHTYIHHTTCAHTQKKTAKELNCFCTPLGLGTRTNFHGGWLHRLHLWKHSKVVWAATHWVAECTATSTLNSFLNYFV